MRRPLTTPPHALRAVRDGWRGVFARRLGPGRLSKKRAIMLVLVLWITTVLSIMCYSTLYTITLEYRLVSTRKQGLEAKTIARAGLARGFVDLRNDLIFDFSGEGEDEPPFDALGDVWANPEEGKEEFEIGNGTFDVTITDAESRFHLNQFRASNRLLLEKIIEYVGYTEEDSKIVASAIIDYADGDDVPVLDMTQGDEGLAYGIIRAEDRNESTRETEVERVNFPNEPYLTVDALLDVYGVTPELYFGPGTPEAEYYAQRMPPREGDLFEMENRRRSRFAGPPVGLRDFFTVYGNGTLNMNTAPEHVLTVLFQAAGRDDGDRLAETVIDHRPGGGRGRLDNDNAFKSLADLQEFGDLAGLLGPIQAFYRIDVRSTVFTVTSTGRVRNAEDTLGVIVTRNLGEMQRVEDFESQERARERERRYENRRARWEDEDNESLVRIPNIRVIEWNTDPPTPREEDD